MTTKHPNFLAYFSVFSSFLATLLLLVALHDIGQIATRKILTIDFEYLEIRTLINFGAISLTTACVAIAASRNIPFRVKPLYIVLIAAFTLAGLAAGLALHYLSMTAWCCENPAGVFYGFPYSWLRVFPPDPFNYQWMRLNFRNPLLDPSITASYQIMPLAFGMDLIFWVNCSLLLLLAAAFLSRPDPANPPG